MAIVPQDVLLFAGTIKENIAYGRPGASEEEMLRAFPKVLSEVAPTPYSTPEKTVRSCYAW
jgi:ABC-type multidrug transport system fused ATPase/permease subunit